MLGHHRYRCGCGRSNTLDQIVQAICDKIWPNPKKIARVINDIPNKSLYTLLLHITNLRKYIEWNNFFWRGGGHIGLTLIRISSVICEISSLNIIISRKYPVVLHEKARKTIII